MSASSSTNDLRNRIIFTIAILAVYRFGTFVPLPGIDPEQLKIMMEGNQKGLLGMFNVFAGGAVSRMAIFALGMQKEVFLLNSRSKGIKTSGLHFKNQVRIGSLLLLGMILSKII